ncbi:hypothetical protein [Endozoicomonas sp. Mp262]|uniref:hypothetical protein n=1 Tax=Endozoicomonas sp. Mp262 TaxID=2919499 RepID=UPI0021DFC552
MSFPVTTTNTASTSTVSTSSGSVVTGLNRSVSTESDVRVRVGEKRPGETQPADQPIAKKQVTVKDLQTALDEVMPMWRLPKETEFSQQLNGCERYEAIPAFTMYADNQGSKGQVVKDLLARQPMHFDAEANENNPLCQIINESRGNLRASGWKYLEKGQEQCFIDRSSLKAVSFITKDCSEAGQQSGVAAQTVELINRSARELLDSPEYRDQQGAEPLLSAQLVGSSRDNVKEQRTMVLYPTRDKVYATFSALDNEAREKLRMGIQGFLELLNKPLIGPVTLGGALQLSDTSSLSSFIEKVNGVSSLINMLPEDDRQDLGLGQLMQVKEALGLIFNEQELSSVTIAGLPDAINKKADYPLLEIPMQELESRLGEIFGVAGLEFRKVEGHPDINQINVTGYIYQRANNQS